MKRVLIVVAHPDDEVLGCGGLMAKYIAKGVDFKVLFIGEGSSCRFASPDSIESRREIEIRNSYAVKALGVLGVNNYKFLNFPCGRFDQVPILEINKHIEAEIDVYKPDSLFTHSHLDTNNDHKIVFSSVMMATRPIVRSCVQQVFSFEILSSSEWNFIQPFAPNTFVSLSSDEIKMKWKALAEYQSEVQPFPFPRSEEGILTLARYRGMQCGQSFAEAFYQIRSSLS